MSDIRIRRGQQHDTVAICRFHKASITTLCSQHYTSEQIKAWSGTKKPEDYEKSIREAVVLVAEQENEPVGFSMQGS